MLHCGRADHGQRSPDESEGARTSVPDLRFDDFAIVLDAARRELDTDGGLGVEMELIAGESAEQVRLADAGVADDDHLEQVVVVVVGSGRCACEATLRALRRCVCREWEALMRIGGSSAGDLSTRRARRSPGAGQWCGWRRHRPSASLGRDRRAHHAGRGATDLPCRQLLC
jgi:hypothetical protein